MDDGTNITACVPPAHLSGGASSFSVTMDVGDGDVMVQLRQAKKEHVTAAHLRPPAEGSARLLKFEKAPDLKKVAGKFWKGEAELSSDGRIVEGRTVLKMPKAPRTGATSSSQIAGFPILGALQSAAGL